MKTKHWSTCKFYVIIASITSIGKASILHTLVLALAFHARIDTTFKATYDLALAFNKLG